VSHFTKVATRINDLEALRIALDKLGKKYAVAEEGAAVTVRGWKGQKLDAQLSIDMGRYDVGVVRAEDGTYELVADWWGVETTSGKKEQEVVDEIQREYAFARVVQACEAQGYAIAREDIEQAEDGTVRLVATRWG
jgi:hypothetical protein